MILLPRVNICENIYDELEFYFRNSKVYLIFSFVNLRYLGKLAIP